MLLLLDAAVIEQLSLLTRTDTPSPAVAASDLVDLVLAGFQAGSIAGRAASGLAAKLSTDPSSVQRCTEVRVFKFALCSLLISLISIYSSQTNRAERTSILKFVPRLIYCTVHKQEKRRETDSIVIVLLLVLVSFYTKSTGSWVHSAGGGPSAARARRPPLIACAALRARLSSARRSRRPLRGAPRDASRAARRAPAAAAALQAARVARSSEPYNIDDCCTHRMQCSQCVIRVCL